MHAYTKSGDDDKGISDVFIYQFLWLLQFTQLVYIEVGGFFGESN